MDVNEMMAWGLTLGQTVFLCGGGLFLLVGLLFLQYAVELGKMLFSLLLFLIAGGACCAAVFFLLANT